MVQTLDAMELLFSTRADRPFVVTIAVDPHIIISAVNHSMHSALAGTELTGHDYLKVIILNNFIFFRLFLRSRKNLSNLLWRFLLSECKVNSVSSRKIENF